MADISQVTLPDNNTYDIKAKELAPQSKTISNVAIASFSDGADNVPVSELIVNITATQAGSGTPSPSNPRAISGWSSCNIHKSGINLWDEEWELGLIDGTTGQPVSGTTSIRSKNYISVIPNMTCYFRISGSSSTNPYLYDKNYNYLGRLGEYLQNKTFVIPSNAFYMKFALQATYGTTYLNDISINYPSTDTSYHSYNGGTTYPISLGDTYYGGTLNITTGELTVTHVIKNIGAADISDNGTSGGLIELFVNGTSNKKNGQTNMICNNLEVRAAAGAYAIRGRAGSSSVTFCLPTSDVPDFISAQTWVTNNPIELVYELSTPTTVQLTPTEVRTLLNCNIFADTGDINKLVYFKTGCESITDIINVMHDDSKMSYSNVYGKKTCNQLTDPGIYYNINPTGSPADGYPTTTLITTYNCQILVHMGLVINTRRVNHAPGGTITFSPWLRLANEEDLDGAVIPYNSEYSTTNTIYDEIEALKQRVKNLGG